MNSFEPVSNAPTTACPAQASVCPLSRVRAGRVVRVKRLDAPPEVNQRLRELGFCEDQTIKLLSCKSNLICQVCNTRLGISHQLADRIWVETVASIPGPAPKRSYGL